MDNALWVIAAIFVVVVLVVFRYREKIGIKFKGFGAEIDVQASNDGDTAQQEAKPNTAAGERSVHIGESADGAKIVTGDNNKVG